MVLNNIAQLFGSRQLAAISPAMQPQMQVSQPPQSVFKPQTNPLAGGGQIPHVAFTALTQKYGSNQPLDSAMLSRASQNASTGLSPLRLGSLGDEAVDGKGRFLNISA